MIPTALETGFALDRLYRWMEGRMHGSKRPTLAQVARVLADAGTPYALIEGVAVQIQRREPRTTLDIDLVLRARSDWPAPAFEKGLPDGIYGSQPYKQPCKYWVSALGTRVGIREEFE